MAFKIHFQNVVLRRRIRFFSTLCPKTIRIYQDKNNNLIQRKNKTFQLKV